MKLKLIAAAALVGWAGVAHAQSSVTLYGIIDSGMLYQSSSAATFAPNAPNTGKIYRFKDLRITHNFPERALVNGLGRC